MALNISLISRLSEDKQLKNLSFDDFNNLIANEQFLKFLETLMISIDLKY